MDLAIQTNDLIKKYGEQTAVKNVNLHVKCGKIYGLLGRNGAGKTTVMKMLLGLTSITSGEAFLFGCPLHKTSQKIYERIGNIIETPGFECGLRGLLILEYEALSKRLNHSFKNSCSPQLLNAHKILAFQ